MELWLLQEKFLQNGNLHTDYKRNKQFTSAGGLKGLGLRELRMMNKADMTNKILPAPVNRN